MVARNCETSWLVVRPVWFITKPLREGKQERMHSYEFLQQSYEEEKRRECIRVLLQTLESFMTCFAQSCRPFPAS